MVLGLWPWDLGLEGWFSRFVREVEDQGPKTQPQDQSPKTIQLALARRSPELRPDNAEFSHARPQRACMDVK